MTEDENTEEEVAQKDVHGREIGEFRISHYALAAWQIEKRVESKKTGEISWKPIKFVGKFDRAVYLLFHAYMPLDGYDSADELIEAMDYAVKKITDKLEDVIIEREKK